VIRTLRDDDVPAAARISRELRPDAMQSERWRQDLFETPDLTQEDSFAVVAEEELRAGAGTACVPARAAPAT
jgi:hypothetical protein